MSSQCGRPVRARRACSRGKSWEKKPGSFPQGHAEQVHNDLGLGVAESLQDFANVGRAHPTTDGDDVIQRAVVALEGR